MLNLNPPAIFSAAPTRVPFTITAPQLIVTRCRVRGCCNTVEHVGEVGEVSTCDRCLDLLSGDIEMTADAAGCRAGAVDEEVAAPSSTPVDLDEEHTADSVDADLAALDRQPVAAPKFRAVTEVVTAPVALLCATCTDATSYLCKCGRRACRECVDGDGLCPQCGV